MNENMESMVEISDAASVLTNADSQNPAQLLWANICKNLKGQMDSDTFELWLKPVRAISYESNLLKIEVPNRFFGEWIKEYSEEKIEVALRNLTQSQGTLEVVVSQQIEPRRSEPRVLEVKTAQPNAPAENHFNPKYTFETFVEGQANRFAKAAAEGVAKEPGVRFNPLFFYGGVGLGKTHLMHAIGHAILNHTPQARILYTTSEKFINEFIDSLRYDRPSDFRNKYRNLDCILIDDIQFLMGKGRSEEEFFNTFNTLFDLRKQIVISSDRPPKEMGALQERMTSRFEWGVVADIQPPDLETRIAILRKKASLDAIHVPEDVILFIASQVRSNIRELEGALIRIVAFTSLTGTPLTVDTARATLKDIFDRQAYEEPISVDTIQDVVARNFNMDCRDLKSRRRTDAIAWPRQIAMYLSRTMTDLSTTEIGESFGGKDHTTVLHACDKVKLKLAESPFIASLVNKITQEIRTANNGD